MTQRQHTKEERVVMSHPSLLLFSMIQWSKKSLSLERASKCDICVSVSVVDSLENSLRLLNRRHDERQTTSDVSFRNGGMQTLCLPFKEEEGF